MLCKKKLKMHAVSMTPNAHNQRMIRAALAAFKENIYQKTLNVPELSYPTTTKTYRYCKFKGVT
jgi:hypothetical protein